MAVKRALITGITGQDGSYLAEYLLGLGYEVHGLVRHTSEEDPPNIRHLRSQIRLHSGDLLDSGSLERTLRSVHPGEVYNLAGMSLVPISWQQPIVTGEVTGLGTTRLLEAIRAVDASIRFYQASSSEMFGRAQRVPQNESTPFYPRSPYGVAKLYSHWMTVNYRESHGIFAASGILFNHESPRRSPRFVTRKVTLGVARIQKGLDKELRLGNLDARRDWGYARDYVQAMHRMLQMDSPRDYVISTGETHSIKEMCEVAFARAGLDWRKYVVVDPAFLRPAEVDLLVGDSAKAKQELGWEPKVKFRELVEMMVDSDLKRTDLI